MTTQSQGEPRPAVAPQKTSDQAVAPPSTSAAPVAALLGVRHTSGPWQACGNGKCKCKIVGASDQPICHVESGEWGDDYPAIRLVGTSSLDQKAEAYMARIPYGTISEDEAIANAHLIAAAPDLLAVCVEVLGFKGMAKSAAGMDIWDRARAAIDKAEGR